jgi:hypothetical protein
MRARVSDCRFWVACGDLIDSDTPGDRIGYRFRIAGDHRNADTKPMKFRDGFTGFGPKVCPGVVARLETTPVKVTCPRTWGVA